MQQQCLKSLLTQLQAEDFTGLKEPKSGRDEKWQMR